MRMLGMASQSMPSRSIGRDPLMKRRNCGGSFGSSAPPVARAKFVGASSAAAKGSLVTGSPDESISIISICASCAARI